MKKIFTASLCLIGIFIAGCWTNFNVKKDQSDTKTNINKEDTFDKKRDCAKEYNEMEKYVDDQYNWEHDYWSRSSYINEVFYSPSLNSCVLIIHYNASSDFRNTMGAIAIDWFSKRNVRSEEESCTERETKTDKWETCNYTSPPDKEKLAEELEALR